MRNKKLELELGELKTEILELKYTVSKLTSLANGLINEPADKPTADDASVAEPTRIYACTELINKLIDKLGNHGLEASTKIYDYETRTGLNMNEAILVREFFRSLGNYESNLFNVYSDGKLIETMIRIKRGN